MPVAPRSQGTGRALRWTGALALALLLLATAGAVAGAIAAGEYATAASMAVSVAGISLVAVGAFFRRRSRARIQAREEHQVDVNPSPYLVGTLLDYTVTGDGDQLMVHNDGDLVGWLSRVYSGGRYLWHFSPSVPLPGAPEPSMPSDTAMGALEAWLATQK